MEFQQQKLTQCYHCGNKGLLNVLDTHHESFQDEYEDEEGNIVPIGPTMYYDWSFMICPVCKKITLVEIYTDDFDDNNYETILYPPNQIDLSAIPNRVNSAYEAALKVKNIDTNIFLLSIRRALEAVCKDKGAKGDNLEKMVKDLIERGILPETYEDACWIIRQLGNKAAHADNVNVYSRQVEQVVKFMEIILNYLYTFPYEVEKLKSEILEWDKK